MKKIIIKGKIVSKDNQKMGRSRSGKFFMRPEYQAFERDVKIQAMQQWGHQPLTGNLRVDIHFVFPNLVRVDLFNAPKSLCDALNKIVWMDDKQIVLGTLSLSYDRENPRAEITVSQIGVEDGSIKKTIPENLSGSKSQNVQPDDNR